MHPSISSKHTQVENLNIHYLIAGQGEPILLLHGWPTSSYLWRNIMPQLSEKYQVIAIDLPGFGGSDKRLDDSFSFKYFNRIISGFLDNLGIQKITLGVHDLGGPLGLYWMTQHMDRVKSLVLLNTLVYPEFSWAVKLFGLSTFLPGIKNLLSSSAGIKKVIYFGVNQKHQLSDEVIQNYQAPFKDSNSRKVLLKSVQRLSPKGFQEIAQKLPSFEGAVQIIYGEKDKILPHVKKTMQRVKKDLPQSTVVALPNCGHFIQEESPEQISQVIWDFMNRNS